MTFSVGPGIAKRMLQYKTEPATSEDYRPDPDDWTYSEAFGKDGRRFVYLRATNQVLVFDVDSAIVAGTGPDPAPPAPAIRQIHSPHFFTGRPHGPPIAIVVHTSGGSLAGLDSWFRNPASEVSSHYGVPLTADEPIRQYVALENSSWANGIREPGNTWPGPDVNPNYLTVAIETIDNNSPTQTVTEAQYAGTLAVCRLALAKYPGIRWLLGHNVISPRTRPNCPGNRWRGSGAFAALARELGLEAL